MTAQHGQNDRPVDEMVREWANATAELADRIGAHRGATRAQKRRHRSLIEALFQAKVFVELIATGHRVAISLHSEGRKKK